MPVNFIDDNTDGAVEECIDCHLCNTKKVSVDTQYETKFGLAVSQLKSLVGVDGLSRFVTFIRFIPMRQSRA